MNVDGTPDTIFGGDGYRVFNDLAPRLGGFTPVAFTSDDDVTTGKVLKISFRSSNRPSEPLTAHIHKYASAYRVDESIQGSDDAKILGLHYIDLDGVETGAFWMEDDDFRPGFVQLQMGVYDSYAEDGVGETALIQIIELIRRAAKLGVTAVVSESNSLGDKIAGLLLRSGFVQEEASNEFVLTF